ncbi:hypothetical protein WA026_000346 [Henosepilachna vigintioctopunctata]|uniref:DEAD-box helicase OB fold domain-containing protein n=1 Tax=Henosepilachna vigintioctopunctata TaxID=420089 RepID=A0AAW1UX98_9CUCU
MQNLFEMKFVPNTDPKCEECNCNSRKIDIVRAVVCAGLYPNIVKIRPQVPRSRNMNMLNLLNGKKAKLHPKSVLNGQYIRNPLLVYYKIVKSSNIYIHDATPVDPFHVIFFGDNFQTVFDGRKQFITINNSLKFSSIEYKISHPSVVDLREENEETLLFRTIIEILEKEVVHCEIDSSGN